MPMHRICSFRAIPFLAAGLLLSLLVTVSVHAEETPTTDKPVDRSPIAPNSFRHDVIPVLTRYGCNQGACHGKPVGQNGFKLSLRGYDPEQDYADLVHGSRGRRVNLAAPASSLLLKKAQALVPHGGGAILTADSRALKVLTDWIAAGAPGPTNEDPVLEKVSIEPAIVTPALDARQQLQVFANYSNGERRDVTWLTRFNSGDIGMVELSPTGEFHVLRQGETVLRATFSEQIGLATVTVPREQAVEPTLYAQRNNLVDEHVMNKLAALRIEPSGNCSDETFLRRVMLDLTATLPTPEEVREFLADQQPDKRIRLVDRLLKRPEFLDYWALQLSDLFQNRRERDHDVRWPKGVRSMHWWLRDQLAQNRPWNELARDVLTAKGKNSASPAIGYFIVAVGEQPPENSDVAAAVAQTFLGTRIGCAKCHNHPMEKFTQDDYYHFLAYFSRVAFDRQNPPDGPTELLIGTQHWKNLRNQLRNEETQLVKLQAEGKDAQQIEQKQNSIKGLNEQIEREQMNQPGVGQPRTRQFMNPQPLDRSLTEIPPGTDPREKLADWMTSPENPYFAGAIVNRLWKHFFAMALVEPVDDLRPSNPPSNQPLWDALTHEFIASGYDLQNLMRLIVLSRTYQLDSATNDNNSIDAKFYSHYYPRRMAAEVLLDAVSQSTAVPDEFPGYPRGVRAIHVPDSRVESYFLSQFGRSERITACACERSGDVTLPQLLHLQNGDTVQQKLTSAEGRLTKLIAATSDKDATTANQQIIEELYLATLARMPNADEQAHLASALSSAGPEERSAVLQDIFWALLNSKDFAFNH